MQCRSYPSVLSLTRFRAGGSLRLTAVSLGPLYSSLYCNCHSQLISHCLTACTQRQAAACRRHLRRRQQHRQTPSSPSWMPLEQPPLQYRCLMPPSSRWAALHEDYLIGVARAPVQLGLASSACSLCVSTPRSFLVCVCCINARRQDSPMYYSGACSVLMPTSLLL